MATSEVPLDLTVQITTPENIRFEYRLAGPFRQISAVLLDFVFRAASITFLFFFLMFLGVIGSAILASGIAQFVLLVSYFLLTWFYGLVFESTMNGQTPGKYLSGIRVLSVDGMPINAVQATVRNFLRVADTAPLISLEIFSPEAPPVYMIPTFGFGLLCMVLTQRMQRLGDIAAGTMVVIDERAWYPKHAKFEDQRIAALAEFIPPGFKMSKSMARAVALYVDRRSMLSAPRRIELAGILGEPLNRQFGFRPDTSPDLTLCALYYREFYSGGDRTNRPSASRGPSPMKQEAVPLHVDQPGVSAKLGSLAPDLDVAPVLVEVVEVQPDQEARDANR